ncbi:hypothetical protein TMEC50S_02255 [Thauera mechernichensis]
MLQRINTHLCYSFLFLQRQERGHYRQSSLPEREKGKDLTTLHYNDTVTLTGIAVAVSD